MKRRRRSKLILFICGGLITVPSFVILFLKLFFDLSIGKNMPVDFMQISGACIALGLIIVSIALQMQSKDVAERNRGLSELFKILSWFWIVTSSITLIWCVFYFIFVK